MAEILTQGKFERPPHIDLMNRTLVDLARGEIAGAAFAIPPGHGKLIADDEMVPTPGGFRTHGSLQPGDTIFGPDGSTTRVIAVSGADVATLRLRFSDGSSVTCHERHEWLLHDRSCHKDLRFEAGALEHLALRPSGVQAGRGSRFRFQLPLTEPLQANTKVLAVRPYVLGAWLGDGTSCKPCITHHRQEGDVVERISRYYPIRAQHGNKRFPNVLQTYFGGSLYADLQEIGVLKNKHIPESYLFASESQRRELLGGLLDTDGSCDQDRCRYRFVNANRRLIDDFCVLVRSLGYRASVASVPPTRSTSGVIGRQRIFTVQFSPHDAIPDVMPRKRAKTLAIRRRIALVGIDRVDAVSGRCIQVERPDGMYLVGRSLIPTHNSFLVSNWHPAWRLALDPTLEIGIGSYNFETARGFSKDVRQILTTYVPEIGVEIEEDSKAAHHWRTSEGGRVLASGIDSNFISHHFHLIIIDDPVKGAEQAESHRVKEGVWDWYRKVVLSRLRPGGAICIVQTRWAIDDLMGRVLLAEKDLDVAGNFRLISIPAIAEQDDPLGRQAGTALWDKVATKESLERTRIIMGSYGFSALYQQRPVPAGGGIFKHQWLNYWIPRGLSAARRLELGLGPVVVDGRECRVVELPEEFDHPGPVQSWDMNFWDEVRAVFRGRQPDPVAGHVWARKGPDYFILDRFHERCGITGTIDAVRDMTERNPNAILKIVEFTANGPTVIAKLQNEIGGFVPATPVGTKVARVHQMIETGTEPDREATALTMFAMVEGGNMFAPHPALCPWSVELRENFGLFPKGGRDDVDAASQAWRRLSKAEWREYNRAHREAKTLDQIAHPKTSSDVVREHMQQERERIFKAKPKGDPFGVWRPMGDGG